MARTRALALATALLAGLAQQACALTQASSLLWYSSPASKEFYAALPIGNGRLGAVFDGYTDKELIRLNEESIWSGGPQLNKTNPEALPNLPILQQQLLTGQLTEGDANWIANFTPIPSDQRAYQPAGQILLDFPHPLASAENYNHSLDISTGIWSLRYDFNGTTFTREAVANHPNNVLAFKLSASKPGALRFNLGLGRDQNITALEADRATATVLLSGTGKTDSYFSFVSKLRVVLDGGHLCTNGTALQIRGASTAWLYYDAETSFYYPDGSYGAVVDSRLAAAVEIGYDVLKADAIKDYQQYYNRTTIDLGNSDVAFGGNDTASRQLSWQKGGNITNDPELLTLVFNMGKYMLISSSRPGTLPANLQGIWNKDFGPPWDSKFTLNINLEMNYWLAQPHNIPEIAEPVYDMLDKLRVTGAKVAKDMYNATGFSCHHNTDATYDCHPYHASSIFSPWPLGGAWLAFEAIEHWRFFGNNTFAAERALPILKENIEFFYSYATERDGWWVTNPGCSPENSYIIPDKYSVPGQTTGLDAGVMMDRGIMWEVLTGFLDMSAALGLTDGVEAAEAFRAKVQPAVIGSYGQLLEWSEEFEENDPGMRHFSPHIIVHPGTWVTPLTNKTASDAAYVLLQHRFANGAGGTSWSIVWGAALYARFFDAANALSLAIQYVSRWVFPNLFSRNGSYFQIDANSGITAAVTEMILQSHGGAVHLGPALPTASGSMRGWVARGGFMVDLDWAAGQVTGAVITSRNGNPLPVRVQDGRTFKVNGVTYTEPLNTVVGGKYTVTF